MDSNHDSILLPASLVFLTLIGEDELIEILKRLPTKIVCRFLCVCKSWKSLISSPLFINLHNSFTRSATPPKLKPYIRVRDKSYAVMCVVDDANHHDLKHKLHFPFRSSTNTREGCASHGFTLVDVIHGVVCISYSSESRFDSTILWNPAIRKYVSLPRLPFPVDLEVVDRFKRDTNCATFFRRYSNISRGVVNVIVDPLLFSGWGLAISPGDYDLEDFCLVGFGYDTSKNDFKVVRIWMPYDKFMVPKYEVVVVYGGGIRRRAAATVPDILKPCNIYQVCKTGCFVNGNIHWIVYSSNWIRSVLMFDCESECFRIVDLPHRMLYSVAKHGRNVEAPQKTKLIEYAGMLSVVVDWCLDRDGDLTKPVNLLRRDLRDFHTELWVMEEHGVSASWTKLYRFKNTFSRPSLLLELDICRDSFVDLAPYSLEQWNNSTPRGDKIRKDILRGLIDGLIDQCVYANRYDEIGSGHVYEESMFLIDHPNAHSYSNQDKEKIVCKEFKTIVDQKPGTTWWDDMVVPHFIRPLELHRALPVQQQTENRGWTRW